MTTLYTGKAKAMGARNGKVETSDKSLSIELATPGAPNAKPGTTNPEQLFACGYAACFGGAVEAVAKQQGLAVKNVVVHSEVDLNKEDSGFSIAVRLNVECPGLSKAEAQKLIEAAHLVCPYSKATKGNINVTLSVKES